MTPKEVKVYENAFRILAKCFNIQEVDLHLSILLQGTDPKSNGIFEFIRYGFRIYTEEPIIQYQSIVRGARMLSSFFGKRFVPNTIACVPDSTRLTYYVEYTYYPNNGSTSNS